MRCWSCGYATNKLWPIKSNQIVVTEGFIRTLKNKSASIYLQYQKNLYNGKLDDIVNECNSISQHNQNEASCCKGKHVYWLWCRK